MTTPPTAAPAEPSLQDQLASRLRHFRGHAGVYVRHLGNGEEAALAADETFPTASMIKVPILAALLDKVERGELDYHQDLVYGKERLYAGEDLLGSFADGSKVALAKVVMLMITTSDNTAALWCQELAGTGTTINDWLAAQGFAVTRVNSRTPERAEQQKLFGWGQTTPREMAEMLVRARQGTLVSPAASEEMQRCLSRIYWDAEALSMIPPNVLTMSKQGAVDRSRSEVVLVCAPHGDYVFCVITKDQEDRSWGRDNEGFVLLRDVSAMLWRHFEPGAPYEPPAGMQKFW
ncbi:MAG TPA: serine hydrolase [Planctomycetota bacterium]|nr:serine hydrolase [Planctomycetota bacterium]